MKSSIESTLVAAVVLGLSAAIIVLGLNSLETIKNTPVPVEVKLTVRAVDQAVEVTPDDKISRTMTIPNNEGALTNTTFISGGKAYMGLFSSLTVYGVESLWQDINILYNTTEIREIEMAINSGGGSAFAGLALADYIRLAQHMGFTVTARASGIVASAAVPVFAAATKRIAFESTVFMVHEASLWKWPGQESHSDIIAQTRLLSLLQTQYLNKLTSRSNKSFDEWKALEKDTTWFSAKQALAWGLVDVIEGD